VLAAGLRRVVVAANDANPRVAGGGLRKLEAAGVRVTVGVLERDARELNRGFFARMTRGTPWVTVKVGASIDGRTALPSGESKWITSEAARRLRASSARCPRFWDRYKVSDVAAGAYDGMRGQPPGTCSPRRTNNQERLLNDGHQTLIFAASTAQAVDHGAFYVNVELLAVRQGRLDLQAALARLAQPGNATGPGRSRSAISQCLRTVARRRDRRIRRGDHLGTADPLHCRACNLWRAASYRTS
jgi:diaminohydroxyphosphoribosylaminopyrimidine deaminase/5-amino-6-(5-phosphoribosylamino)uracil reductase